MMSTIGLKPVENTNLKLRKRKKYPWDEMLSLILQGKDFFAEVDRRSAHYIKRKLNMLLAPLGIMVDAIPATDMQDGKEVEGYIISVSEVRGEIMLVDKNQIKKQLKDEILKRIKRAEGELNMLNNMPADRKLTKTKIQLKTRIQTLRDILKLVERL